jgi:hypothetical protein
MAFINEYISEEDMKKYDIKGVWKKYHPSTTDEEAASQTYTWTIDRDREAFFIPIMSGREEFSGQKTCAFWWKGTLFSVLIVYAGGALDYAASKGSVVWELLNILKPTSSTVPDAEIIPLLKDALTAYRLSGVAFPINDYQVTFKF